MENATKALIIAGAILVAILLVTMGISLLNNTGGLQNQQDQLANSMDISSFNGTFTPAEGNNVTGSKVKGVLEKVYSIMLDNNDELDLTITINGTTVSDHNALDTEIKKIQPSSKYKCETEKNQDTGYINKFTVTKK